MKKGLLRLLKPNTAVQYLAMLIFCIITLLAKQFLLAAVELAVSFILFLVFLLYRKYRRKKIEEFVNGEYAGVISSGGNAYKIFIENQNLNIERL